METDTTKKQPTTTIMNITDRPDSYEFGKAGNRFKVYLNLEDLERSKKIMANAKKILDDNTEIEQVKEKCPATS